jgi:4a-hydroxytetrahydrobiopterin dehydratase
MESEPPLKRRACTDWPLLEEERVLELMPSHPLWTLVKTDGAPPMISRKFCAKNFQSCLEFIAAAGSIAEEQGHHPDFHLTSYRYVEVVIYSHTQGGLTENDFVLANAIDSKALVVYSPKWLKENPHAEFSACQPSGKF